MTLSSPLTAESLQEHRFWWKYLKGYHWYVLIICVLGWTFDCADQMIFTSSRSIAMRDLMPHADTARQTQVGTWATTLFMLGWATGGLVFGSIGDKWGRAKTMALTVFLYGACTGLSALARNWQEFAGARFVTGFGVGGEFAAGAALVADVMPAKARAEALGLLQALSAGGNILGAWMLGISASVAHTVYEGQTAHGALKLPYTEEHLSWRYLYWAGAFPALVAVLIMARMKEPEKWVKAKADATAAGQKNFGRISDLFTDARWRRNALVGVALAISGVIGLWGIGFYSPELIDASIPQMSVQTGTVLEAVVHAPDDVARAALITAFDKDAAKAYSVALTNTAPRGELTPKATNVPGLAAVHLTADRLEKLENRLAIRMEPAAAAGLKSKAIILQQIGAFLGMLTFSLLATRIGRKPTFVLSFIAAWAAIAYVFLGFHYPWQIWYLYPLLGFCTLLPFGGYAIYFPELFPTRLRTTGTGFCYNVGRYVAALGPLAFGAIQAQLAGKFDTPSFRVAAVIVASVYLVGIIAAFMGPETMNQPLPEDAVVPAH